MMKWIEHRFLHEDLSEDPFLPMAGEASVAINKAVSQMYESSVLLDPSDSAEIGGQGMRFLRRYAELSAAAKNDGRALFVVMPKHHAIQKMMLTLLAKSEQAVPSVQQDEDFIGRPSRVSRRVTSRTTVMVRVMRRYLQSAYRQYLEGGYLIRPT